MGPIAGLDAVVVNNELARTWKGAIDAEFHVISLYLPVRTEKATQSLGKLIVPSVIVQKNAANNTNDCSHAACLKIVHITVYTTLLNHSISFTKLSCFYRISTR